MTYVLAFVCVLLLAALLFTGLMVMRLSKFIFELEDDIEDSLDLLDKRHKRIYDVLQIPVASDDPMIRTVIGEIKGAREDILVVANKLVSFTLMRGRDEENSDA